MWPFKEKRPPPTITPRHTPIPPKNINNLKWNRTAFDRWSTYYETTAYTYCNIDVQRVPGGWKISTDRYNINQRLFSTKERLINYINETLVLEFP